MAQSAENGLLIQLKELNQVQKSTIETKIKTNWNGEIMEELKLKLFKAIYKFKYDSLVKEEYIRIKKDLFMNQIQGIEGSERVLAPSRLRLNSKNFKIDEDSFKEAVKALFLKNPEKYFVKEATGNYWDGSRMEIHLNLEEQNGI